MHLASMILFSIEQKEKFLIARSKDFICNECAFEEKTMNDLNFAKFINLINIELDSNLNNKNIIY